jgi:hypothetical protein
MFQAKASFVANATGQRTLFLFVNGGASAIARTDQAISGTAENQTAFYSQLYYGNVGDYFEVKAFQTSGGALSVNYDATESTFSATYLGA